jgi:hypothetical protein
MQALVSQPGSSLSLLTSRFRTRISHLRGRLAHLTTLDPFPTNITTWHNQELHGLLDRIEQHIASPEVVDRRGQEQEARDDMDYMAQGATRRTLACYAVGWATVWVLWRDKRQET